MPDQPDGERSVGREVAELLGRRATIQGYLEALTPLEGTVATRVFQKVRADYAARIEEVGASLADRLPDLEAALGPRREAIREIARERDASALALEETTLRYRAGEFDTSEWEGRRAVLERAVGELDVVLTGEREVLTRLEALRGEVVGAVRADSEGVAPDELDTAAEFRLVKSWSAGNRTGLVARSEEAEQLTAGPPGPPSPR